MTSSNWYYSLALPLVSSRWSPNLEQNTSYVYPYEEILVLDFLDIARNLGKNRSGVPRSEVWIRHFYGKFWFHQCSQCNQCQAQILISLEIAY